MPAGASTTRSRSYVLLPQARPMATNHLKSQGLYEAHTDTYQPSETRVHTLAWRDRQTRHRDRDRDRDIDTCTQMFGCKPICKHLSSKAGQYANKIQQVKLSQIESNWVKPTSRFLPVSASLKDSAWVCTVAFVAMPSIYMQHQRMKFYYWALLAPGWKMVKKNPARCCNIYIYLLIYIYVHMDIL